MTSCSRCGAVMDGFGVVQGLVGSTADPDTGRIDTSFLCYANGCRDAVLGGDVNHDAVGVCTRCGQDCERAPDVALLTTDMRPDDSGLPRMLTFCRANGCADVILDRVTEGA